MSHGTLSATLLIPLLTYAHSAQGLTSGSTSIEIHDIRIGLHPGKTRIVFDLSGPTTYKLIVQDQPSRVTLDLPNTTTSLDHSALPLRGTPNLKMRRETQHDSTLHYVFDVKEETITNIFALEPNGIRGHRLVLDLSEPEIPSGGWMSDIPASTATEPLAKIKSDQSTPRTAGAASSTLDKRGSGVLSGHVSLDTRLFFQSPAYQEQDRNNVSVAFKPEYYIDWANGKQRFALSPFFRYDANDDERTHADIRELYWRLEYGKFLIKAGLDVVFWGVAESRHLVDIINQTDLVENIDGEEKLGQPMLNLDYMSDWGTWQLYVLPYFRERTFPGEDGRLRTNPVVDTDDPEYQSSDEQDHVDFAVRWSHYIGDWDIGLAHFSGTSRDPLLTLSGADQKPVLIPNYLQVDQTSLDVQATKGAWLWKLEALYNKNDLDDYYAYVGGFEYTQFGIAGSATDLGWLMEYNYDQRGERSLTALENDIYFGMRLSGNDMAGSQLLTGIAVDTDNQSTFVNIEATRRLGESWTITLESRFFSNIDRQDPLYFIKEDDYIEIQFSRYF